jgi:hypothetical protein
MNKIIFDESEDGTESKPYPSPFCFIFFNLMPFWPKLNNNNKKSRPLKARHVAPASNCKSLHTGPRRPPFFFSSLFSKFNFRFFLFGEVTYIRIVWSYNTDRMYISLG